MTNFLWQKSKRIKQWLPKLQAHRGYCLTGAVENTLQSIQKAVELSYQIIEFDVRLTKDLEVILFHDHDILENKIRRKVAELTLIELRKTVFVDRLEDVLFWLRSEVQSGSTTKLNIELKTESVLDGTLEKKVVALIETYGLENQILISSFNPLALARIRFLNNQIFRALLLSLQTAPKNKWYLKKLVFNVLCRPHALHLSFDSWSEARWGSLNNDIPVVLWTYNGDLKDLKGFNIHGIISDQITPQDFKACKNTN